MRRAFDQVFVDETSKARKIPQSQFRRYGRYAIVDQGADFIAGYTDDRTAAWRGALPVVVFGDHTRAIKFVDFPFVLGADGCKVLTPRPNIEPLLAYYALLGLDLAGAGYSRHFKFLREQTFSIPAPPEQRRIVAQLAGADRLRRMCRHALDISGTFLPAAFLQMFGDPVSNPLGFEKRRLIDVIRPERPITYGILKPGPHVPDGVPYIRVTDIQNRSVLVHQVKRTTRSIDAAYKRSRLIEGDLLLSIRGHVGRMGVVPETLAGANITQDTARLSPTPDVTVPFLMGCLDSVGVQRIMERETRGLAVKGINLGDVKLLPVIVPPKPMQERYSRLAFHYQRLGAQQGESLRQSEHLFQTLLHRSFS